MSTIDDWIYTAVVRLRSDDPGVFMKGVYGLERAERWIDENKTEEQNYSSQQGSIQIAYGIFRRRKEDIL